MLPPRVALVSALLVAGALPPPQAAPSAGTYARVVVLGTGTPNADPDRWGPAVAVLVDGESYLVDAGVGIVRHAAATKLPELAPKKLTRVFITHLHSDHTLGLPDLIFSPWVLDRAVPLDIYGPPGIAAMTANIEAAWSADVALRLSSGEPEISHGPRSAAHEIHPGRVYEDGRVTVDAIPVTHGTWPDAFGYRFATADRVIVISGDTTPVQSIVDACRGCDVLVHEVYSAVTLQSRTPEWRAYHRAFHTSTVELAEIASKARPKLLVLYHQLYWGASDSDLIAEIRRAGYQGLVVSAHDLGIYE